VQEYGVGPSVKPPWTLDRAQLAVSLRVQWSAIRIWAFDSGPDSSTLLEAVLPLGAEQRESRIALQSGQFVILASAEPSSTSITRFPISRPSTCRAESGRDSRISLAP
jgi:hypothetical protein